MQLVTIVWLAILGLLLVLFIVTLRRMSALVSRTRTLERFQAAIESLNLRLATAVGPLVRALDEARRHAADAARTTEILTHAQSVLDDLRAELERLEPPGPAADAVTGMRGELARAIRAASLVEHGLGAMQGKSLGRDLEAQTALKRGALNLRHAQDAFGQHARRVAELRPADLAGVAGPSHPPVGSTPEGAYQGLDADDLEGGFDPRM